LSLHDALPIWSRWRADGGSCALRPPEHLRRTVAIEALGEVSEPDRPRVRMVGAPMTPPALGACCGRLDHSGGDGQQVGGLERTTCRCDVAGELLGELGQ